MEKDNSLEERADFYKEIMLPGYCFHVLLQDRRNGTYVSGPVQDFIGVSIVETMKLVNYASLAYVAVSKLL